MIQISELHFCDELRNGKVLNSKLENQVVNHLREWFANLEIKGKFKVVNE